MTTSSTATSSTAHSLADLAQQPCLALSHEDTIEFSVFDASETDLDGKSCQWGARGGLVAFTPYTSTDQTADAQFQHLTPTQIDGHRALLGTVERGGECIMPVAVGTNQSFRLIVSSFGEGTPGPDACTVATNFATAIVAHLR